MESFYSQQVAGYDDFREKLLPGRRELMALIPFEANQTWVDLGGGTGANLDFIPQTVSQLKRVQIVDLSVSLLERAQRRARDQDWPHVETICGDATRFEPDYPVDIVTCSYSLTMIPDWFAAIDQAWRMLKPGGVFAVVDFFVSRKYADEGYGRHSWLTRTFWPAWFASDNVFLSSDHVRYLHHRFEAISYCERLTRLPYMPLSQVPYYIFIGHKPL